MLLKLSGEALMGELPYGTDPERVAAISREIAGVHERGVEVAIVVGGGNIYRGLAEAARGTGWTPLLPDPPLRSGILLYQAEDRGARRAAPEQLRARFQEKGLALTAYNYKDGIMRLSMLKRPWRRSDIDVIRRALRQVR